jgi:hypothetical protein
LLVPVLCFVARDVQLLMGRLKQKILLATRD